MRRSVVTVVVLALAGALSGCTAGTATTPPASTPAAETAAPSRAPSAAPFTFAVTPEMGAKDLPISAEIGTAVTGGEVTSVTVSEESGGNVAGELRADKSAWVPAKALKNSTGYTATVVATDASGHAETKTT